MVSGVVPSPRRYEPSVFGGAYEGSAFPLLVDFFHRMLLTTHALALSASQFVHKKRSVRIDTNTHSDGLELTRSTYSRHEEDNMLHRRRDRPHIRIYTRTSSQLAW